MNENHAIEVLSKNLRALMVFHDLTAPALQQKSGVGRTTINNIRNCSFRSSVDTIQKLADCFKLPAWALLVPGLDMDLRGVDIDSLMVRFLASDDAGRAALLRFALSEAERG